MRKTLTTATIAAAALAFPGVASAHTADNAPDLIDADVPVEVDAENAVHNNVVAVGDVLSVAHNNVTDVANNILAGGIGDNEAEDGW